MAFKITDEQFGQLTYTSIYQGTLNKGDTVYNTRTKKKVRVGRMVRMNSNDRENIDMLVLEISSLWLVLTVLQVILSLL
jgi:elongation factor G